MMKKLIIEVAKSLPDNADFDDFIDELYIRIRVEKGLEAVRAGNVLTEEEVLEELRNAHLLE